MSDEQRGRRWHEIDRLFERALDRPVEERLDFVRAACGGDTEVFEAVSRLLAAADGAGGILDDPWDALTPELWEEIFPPGPDRDDDLVGEVVGSYRVVRRIGHGGMGSVFLAERADGAFERQVAVKLLRTDQETEAVVRRFRSERQILASLGHPNVARLLDGGSAPDGRPYLIMEYVAGERIDRHCDARGMSVRGRIELFLDVLGAVEHAHRNLVVHRDLKPSNILVSDSDGTVKLLDFGVAKLINPSIESGDDNLTHPGSRFLTPGYAAPEQLLGERVRIETDVYALCAVLYELLTGARPYLQEGRESVLHRVVGGTPPPFASETIVRGSDRAAEGSGGPEPEARARARSTTVAGLRKALRGDLDAILVHGLRARPEERYGSATELREDLVRHLEGRPVRARGDARLYRARRFIRRHWLSVGAAAVFLAVLAGSALGLALQRSAVVAERNRAEIAAATADQVTEFMVGLFEGADPRLQLGDAVSARFLLDEGARRLQTELAEQPEVMADLLQAMGRAYTGLGAYEQAVVLFERAEGSLRESVADSSEVAETILRRADAHLEARDFGPAEEAYRAALSTSPLGSHEDSVRFGQIATGLGQTLRSLGRLDEAETWIRRGVEVLESVPDADRSLLTAQTTLAGFLNAMGEKDQAVELYEEVLDRQRAVLGPDHIDVANTLNNLGYVHRTAGRNREAADLYRQGMERVAAIYGRGHPETLLFASNLANALSQDGAQAESVEVYRENVRAAEMQWPEGHWRLAREYMYLGGGLLLDGRPEEAVEPLRRSVEMNVDTRGADHPETPVLRAWMGAALALSGREVEAAAAFERAVAALSVSESFPDNGPARGMLGALVNFMRGWELMDAADRFASFVE